MLTPDVVPERYRVGHINVAAIAIVPLDKTFGADHGLAVPDRVSHFIHFALTAIAFWHASSLSFDQRWAGPEWLCPVQRMTWAESAIQPLFIIATPAVAIGAIPTSRAVLNLAHLDLALPDVFASH